MDKEKNKEVQVQTNEKGEKVDKEKEKLKETKEVKRKKYEKKEKKDIEKKEGKKKEVKGVFKHINYLLLTEKGVDNIHYHNTLVFIVNLKSTKPEIKKEVEKMFNVKVKKINTLIDRKGRKKAYVKLADNYSAVDVATKLGMM